MEMDQQTYERVKTQLINSLIEGNFIKFGQFKLKSGVDSDYYVNLRETSDRTDTFKLLIQLIKQVISTRCHRAKVVCGVPDGAVPMAAVAAYSCQLPYHQITKSTKSYGDTSMDAYNQDEPHILIEDVMSSGSSILETIHKMGNRRVSDVIVIVNRKQGGDEKLRELYPNIRLHSIIDVEEILKEKK